MATPAYSYIRMSNPEQIRGDSLRRQQEASQRYAHEHGLDLDDSLRDIGLSAYSGAHRLRGALGAFLGMVERGEPRGSVLIVESLARLSRETVVDATKSGLPMLVARSAIMELDTPEALKDPRLYWLEECWNSYVDHGWVRCFSEKDKKINEATPADGALSIRCPDVGD